MSSFALFVIALALAAALVAVWSKWRTAARAEFIRSFKFPKGLFEKLLKKRPELTLKDCQLVGHALRQYFLTYLKSGRKLVSMPSQVADELWHELILYTKTYQHFCRRAFGGFMHHTPAVALGSVRESNAGLRRCWWYACKEENINPRNATRLPLLFALDAKLNIAGGFRYVADCTGVKESHAGNASAAPVYCGGDFASAQFDGTTDGFGASEAGGGDGSGSAGCSGGCSGGCGGGGD